jgi:formylglycine-generating enzyme required for sulfatase activity
MEFIRVKAGEFLMGSPDSDKDADNNEKLQHKVKITKDFYLGKYPVTQEQYYAVTGQNPSSTTSDYFRYHEGKVVDTRHYPVEHVSWDMATAFCGELRQRDKQKRKFCLPTEAEWEYAQRAGTTTRYSFGDDPADLTAYAWYSGNSGGKPHEVGAKKPNAWGLYDMEGDVWHWCADWYAADYYLKSPATDPQGPDTGTLRVVRGNQYGGVRGSLPGSGTANSRCAARLGSNRAGDDTGFRVCLRVEQGGGDDLTPRKPSQGDKK